MTERFNWGSVSLAASSLPITSGQFGQRLLQGRVAADMVAVSMRVEDGCRLQSLGLDVLDDLLGL